MKTIKPANMAIFSKTQVLENKDILSIAVFATLKFTIAEPRLLDEQVIWDISKSNLDKEEALDSGIPKHRAEFLIYGSCEVSKPVSAIGVHANVGELSKTLVVIGDRNFTRFGVTDPKPFTSLPINYKNAFGGEGFPNNPIGKGFTNNGEQVELPNIENPNAPITRKSDKPDPVGFSAYPQMWPQRMQYFGNITSDYLKSDWPGFPKGTNPEYFNTAPMDQRLNGFFVGNESFSIKNMNAQNPNQISQLPGLRARVFVVQITEDKHEVFKELISRAETLWLFPNQEIGSLLYRSSIEVADEDYSDITKLYAVWEDITQPPQSIEYYYSQMIREITPTEDLADSPKVPMDIPPKVEKIIPKTKADSKDLVPKSDPELLKAMKELEDLNAKMLNELRKKNTDIAQEIQKYLPQSSESSIDSLDLKEVLKQLELKNTELVKTFNISPADINKILAKANESPKPVSINDVLKTLNEGGEKNQEFIANIQNLQEQVDKLKLSMPQNTEAPNNEPEPKEAIPKEIPKTSEPPQSKPILSPRDNAREDVIKQYNIDKNLSNLDLSNLDLSDLDLKGADFSSSILENTNMKNTILDKSLFKSSRISGANFSNSSLEFCKFEDVFGTEVKFNNAKLNDTNIENSDFQGCDFTSASLNKSVITGTNFEGSNFENALLQELNANKASFIGTNFIKINITNSVLTKCDLSKANISNTNFTEIDAFELKLNGTIGSSANFLNANLASSRASSDTLIEKSNFQSANFTQGAWADAKLPESNFTLAILDEANFSNVLFDKSCFELASAKNTNFSKSSFVDSNLNRINLFKGSLRRATITEADFRYSNLYAVDFFKAKVGNTKFKGANLKQTLFDVMGIDVEKL